MQSWYQKLVALREKWKEKREKSVSLKIFWFISPIHVIAHLLRNLAICLSRFFSLPFERWFRRVLSRRETFNLPCKISPPLWGEDLGGCYPVGKYYKLSPISPICLSGIFSLTNMEELRQPLEKHQKFC